MYLTKSVIKKAIMERNRSFSPTVNRLALFTVCVIIAVIELIYLNIVATNVKTDILEYKSDTQTSLFKIEMRPDLMDIVNPSDPKYPMPMNGPYLLENTSFCSSTTNLTVLVVVLSSAKHFINRQVLRQTWANGSLFSNYGTVQTLFLLGRTNDATAETKIENEFRLFGDIVQGNFVDSLRNLTLKSIMGYNWVMKRCRNVKFVIKTDDDIVLNMFEIAQNRILETSLKNHHVLCRRFVDGSIVRNKMSKFFVETRQFNGKVYPPYCSGQFVAMVNDLIPFLYEAAVRTPYFWIDDVHMYGLSMSNIPALKYKQLQKEEYGSFNDIASLKRLRQKKNRSCPTLYFDTTDSTQVVKLWSALFDVYHRRV